MNRSKDKFHWVDLFLSRSYRLPPDPEMWERVYRAIQESPPFWAWFKSQRPMARVAYTIALCTLLITGFFIGKEMAHFYHQGHPMLKESPFPTVEAGSWEAYEVEDEPTLWEETL